jgi:serine/threonine-protein kinase
VKPANIMLRPDDSVKLTDFGIAWSASSVPLTKTGMIVGTPQYLSPEQAVGEPASPASDVYSLGLVGYECLTGHAAFDGDNPIALALKQVNDEPQPLPDEIPDGVRSLIDAALAKDPHDRIPDGAAFALAAEQTVDEPPEPATGLVTPAGMHSDTAPALPIDVPPGGAPHPRRWARLVLVPLLAVGLAVGAAAAVRGLAGGEATVRPAAHGTSRSHGSVASPSVASPSGGAAPASDQAAGTGGPAPTGAAQTAQAVAGTSRTSGSTLVPAAGARSVAAGASRPAPSRAAASTTASTTAAARTTSASTTASSTASSTSAGTSSTSSAAPRSSGAQAPTPSG